VFVASDRVDAQQSLSHQQMVDRENSITVRVVTGDMGEASSYFAADLAQVLNEPGKLRVLPVLSGGGIQNITDLLYLKGVDVGFVRSDILNYVKYNGVHRNIENRIRYISKLHVEKILVLAGASVSSIQDLAGRPVNFGEIVSGEKGTPELLFETLGISVGPVYLDQVTALERLKAGEIAATVVVSAQPNEMVTAIGSEDGLKLLPIEASGAVLDIYQPSTLSNEDYPNLIAPGTTLKTLATDVVMAMYNWPRNHSRYRRVGSFVKQFFAKFAELRKTPRHPKWREVNLAAAMPGWERFEPAKEWLEIYGIYVPSEPALAKLRVNFEDFLKRGFAGDGQTVSNSQRAEMFRVFLSWAENPAVATIQVRKTSADGIGKHIGTIKARNTEILVAGRKEQALLLTPDLRELPPGPHAFHIHSKPDCGSAEKDGVTVAGLAAGPHLFLEAGGKTYGYHLGDLPDLTVAPDGTATDSVLAPRLTLADLLNRSIMVHSTQNDSSGRQACGVVQ